MDAIKIIEYVVYKVYLNDLFRCFTEKTSDM